MTRINALDRLLNLKDSIIQSKIFSNMRNSPNEIDDEDFKLGREGLLYTYAQITHHLSYRYRRLSEHEDIKQPKEPNFPRSFTYKFEQEYEIQGLRVQSIINTAFFFEAYINDYCLRYLGKSKTNSLDKLDTPSKYLIVTELVWSRGFDKSINEFSQIKKLFSLRNKLAHPKSSSKGNVLEVPKIFDEISSLTPDDNVILIWKILKIFLAKKNDPVTEVMLKQVKAWDDVAINDLDFYPIPNNAGI